MHILITQLQRDTYATIPILESSCIGAEKCTKSFPEGVAPLYSLLDIVYPHIRVSTRMWVPTQIWCRLTVTQLAHWHVGTSWPAGAERTSAGQYKLATSRADDGSRVRPVKPISLFIYNAIL